MDRQTDERTEGHTDGRTDGQGDSYLPLPLGGRNLVPICLSVHPSVRPSIHLSFCLSVSSSVRPSFCLSVVRPTVCPSVDIQTDGRMDRVIPIYPCL
jgi:hypothetical protein